MSRYWWIAETTTDPSPTPDATRLIDPDRTSPTAKMPGFDASKGEFHSPVRTNPALSSARLKGFPKIYNGVIDVSSTWLE